MSEDKFQWNKVFTIIKDYPNGISRSKLCDLLKTNKNNTELNHTIDILLNQRRIKQFIGVDEKGRLYNLIIAIENLPKNISKREKVSNPTTNER